MFIVFEGGDGSGKSTVAKELAKYIRNKYPEKSVVETREPGGTDLSEEIRNLLLYYDKETPTAETEMLLMAASRAQHYETKIKPNRYNNIVICDRFVGSSIIYQGYGRGIDINRILEVNKPMIEDPADILFIFDVDIEVGLNRVKNRMKLKNLDRLDKEDLEFHLKVRKGLLELEKYKKYIGKNIFRINANKSLDEINTEVFNIIDGFLEKEVLT